MSGTRHDARHSIIRHGAREVLVAIVRLLTALNLLLCEQALGCDRTQQTGRRLGGWRDHCPYGGRQSSCGREQAVPSTTSPQFAPGLTLKPPARLDPVEIAVDIELQQDRRKYEGRPVALGVNPAKSKFRQIEFVDKNVDDANRIVLADPVFQQSGNRVLCPRSAPSSASSDPPANRARTGGGHADFNWSRRQCGS
jgi:hypothetical protein